jgi:DNA-binding ferritin-like protein
VKEIQRLTQDIKELKENRDESLKHLHDQLEQRSEEDVKEIQMLKDTISKLEKDLYSHTSNYDALKGK